jgi:hypothetical protein
MNILKIMEDAKKSINKAIAELPKEKQEEMKDLYEKSLTDYTVAVNEVNKLINGNNTDK